MRLWSSLPVAASVCLIAAPLAHPETHFGLPLEGAAAESFLRSARVAKRKTLAVGITRSAQLALTDGAQRAHAVWKTIDDASVNDSWKHEVAAYELDKLVGTGLVPPTVERTIDGVTGSLQLWVEKATTEADRRDRHVSPPDAEAWSRQMCGVGLLHQLTSNSDAQNFRNVILDGAFRVYAVDFSRAFGNEVELRREPQLRRFPRQALGRLRALDPPTLEARLSRWLDGRQIESLLKRRDLVLDLAERLVAEKGEREVLF
jgi:hypothetical protein